MNRYSMVVALFTAVILALTINIAITLTTSSRLSKEVFVVCAEHKTIARIAKEEAEESAESNRNLLARINIPGLSHRELVETTNKKQLAQLRHAAEYSLIQKETC